LLNSFRIQKVLGGSCPVCSSIVMMQQQSAMPCSWVSCSDCSKNVRETLSAIPRTSHFVLGKKQYCCYMTCSTDKHSNHLFGNGATVKELMRGSLSDRDPLLRLLPCLVSKQYNHGSTPLMMCQTAFDLPPSNLSSMK